MRRAASWRVIADWLKRDGLREKYWWAREVLERLSALAAPAHRSLAPVVWKSQMDFVFDRVRPVRGQTRQRMRAAVEWLQRAQDATPDGGVAFGYFPTRRPGTSGWLPSYPETTGYIIPSLLEYAAAVGDASIRERARRMGSWETAIQMPCGAVQGGTVCSATEQRAAVFNTGAVLQGYVALLLEDWDERIFEGARRAAEFLVQDLAEDGHFRTHGPFVTYHRVKTYNCLCAWPLFRLGQAVNDRRYVDAALRAVEAALGEQRHNRWFANNCKERPEAPLTHTIGYTMQGILEVGLLSGREEFVAAVEHAAQRLLALIAPSGFLHGRYYADWEPANFSSCLTGSAQIAVVLYRLFEHTGDQRFRDGANRLVDFLKAMQVVDSPDPDMKGALPGSFPMMGEYMPGGYPSWATKYFLDALMLQERTGTARAREPVSLPE